MMSKRNSAGLPIGGVYCFFVEPNFYKIGISIEFQKREKSLNTVGPFHGRFIMTHAYANMKHALTAESRAHLIFSKYRVNGEWFKLTEAQLFEGFYQIWHYKLLMRDMLDEYDQKWDKYISLKNIV